MGQLVTLLDEMGLDEIGINRVICHSPFVFGINNYTQAQTAEQVSLACSPSPPGRSRGHAAKWLCRTCTHDQPGGEELAARLVAS